MSPRLLSLLITGALLTTSSVAQSYTFSNTCAPVTRYETGREAPNVLVILDNSGSMSGTKWNTAVQVVKELADAVTKAGTCSLQSRAGCDDIRLGLGYFGHTAWTNVQPEDRASSSPIHSSLNSTSPNGSSTNMDLGTAQIVNNNTLKDASRTSLGVFITDGEPNPTTSTQGAKNNLCNAKLRASAPVATYVVGFGSGANPHINSMLAAAGGTGVCRTSTNQVIDVCSLTNAQITTLQGKKNPLVSNPANNSASCAGALQADSGQALKDGLLNIATNAACTFPLTIPANYPSGAGADEDPFATKVVINHYIYGANVEVQPYLANDPNAFYNYLVNARGVTASAANIMKGDGWVFADQTRKNIRFTEELCQEIAAGRLNIVDTQVACLCEKTGQACTVPGQLGVCQQGVYVCQAGRDVCQQTKFPTAEVCNNLDDDCDGVIDDIAAAGDDCAVPGKLGRCSLGTITCTNGNQFCKQSFQPMPEVCNGLDDDCDGKNDDLKDSKTDPAANWTANTLPAQYAGLTCNFQNTCACDSKPRTHQGNNLSSYLSTNWAQKCRCAEGIFESEEQASFEANSDEADADATAGCSVTTPANDAAGSISLILSLGFLAAFTGRRRKQS